MTDLQPVMDAAATFLSVRQRSVTETRRRLRHLGYPHSLVDTVLDRFVEMGYLDDMQFARAWVESRDRARPKGEAALRRELALKGIARQVIDDVLAERLDEAVGDDPNTTAATALLERRRSALEREQNPVKRRQKAYGLLARNGFDPETARQVASSFMID